MHIKVLAAILKVGKGLEFRRIRKSIEINSKFYVGSILTSLFIVFHEIIPDIRGEIIYTTLSTYVYIYIYLYTVYTLYKLGGIGLSSFFG